MEEIITLKIILDALFSTKNNHAKKRLIYDQSQLNGIGRKKVIAFFFSLPIILFLGIFNPAIFPMLGIAQAVVFYIVFLSMAIGIIIITTFANNNKVLRQIEDSWAKYFPSVELPYLLSGGVTPYKDFLKHYDKALLENLEGEALHTFLEKAFTQMQEENQELYNAINRDKSREREAQ